MKSANRNHIQTEDREILREQFLALLDLYENSFYLEDTRDERRFTVFAFGADKTFDVKNQKELLALEKYLMNDAEELSHLPFSGGLIGLLDFEFSYSIHGLESDLDPDHNDHCSHKKYRDQTEDSNANRLTSQTSHSYFHLINDFVVVDHNCRKTHFISINQGADRVQQMRQVFSSPFFNNLHDRRISVKHTSSAEDERVRFEEKFSQIKFQILHGNLFQCVIADKKQARLDGSPTTVLKNLCEQNKVPYVFFLKRGDHFVCGASPERLIEVDKSRTVKTSPIAGTRPRSNRSAKDRAFALELINCEKEQAEHLMLVDLARNDLGRVCQPHSVRVEQFQKLKKFDYVMHLVSEVQGQLEDQFGPLEALSSCFPAGTLSGAPKREALKNIRRLEESPRGSYGGAIVMYDHNKNLNSFIVIRSLEGRLLKTGEYEISYGAGAGIVNDSKLIDEFKEINNKASTVERSLAPRTPSHFSEKIQEIGG